MNDEGQDLLYRLYPKIEFLNYMPIGIFTITTNLIQLGLLYKNSLAISSDCLNDPGRLLIILGLFISQYIKLLQ